MLARALSSVFVTMIAIATLLACNDHDPHPAPLTDPGTGPGPGGSGGSTPTGGGTSGTVSPLDAGVCTDLDDPTSARDEIGSSDPLIPGTGGTIVDGTYDLTSVQRYVGTSGQAGDTGRSYKEVMRITDGTTLERIRVLQINSGGGETTENASFVLTQTAGSNSITLSPKCPTLGTNQTLTFTAQGTTLTLTSLEQQFTYTARP